MNKKRLIPLLLVNLLTACNNNPESTNTAALAPNATELASPLEERFFKQIKGAMETVESQKLWPGYEYKSISQYFIHREGDSPVSGFIINPKSNLSQAQLLGKNESHGLKIVRFEADMYNGLDKLKSGNDAYDFDYKIDGKNYYLQSYTKDEVDIANPKITSAYALAVHEVFHSYQSHAFKQPSTYQQLAFDKFSQYPLDSQSIALQLMQLELLKTYPIKNITQQQAINALKRYYVLTNQMFKADTSAHSGLQTGWVYKHSLGQELFEGTAYYIDTMVSRAVGAITKDITFVTSSPFEMDKKEDGYAELSTKESVESYFAFQIFYHTGASAVWLLRQAGYNLATLETGITPYQAAKEHLNMSALEEIKVLDSIKKMPQWQQAQSAALRYSKLK